MTRSNNCSELRKMSNPIPINVSSWQIRSQKRNEDTSKYDPGIMDNCVKNSVSPLSGYSISPSQSISPLTEINRLNKHLNHHSSALRDSFQSRQLDRNREINQLLNENTESSGHFDVQSELESLLVNATISDETLASNMSNNHDNSNTSTKFTSLNNDDLCDIDMSFDTTNFSQTEFSNSNNAYVNINKLEPIMEKSFTQSDCNLSKLNDYNFKQQPLKSSPNAANLGISKDMSKLVENEIFKTDLYASSQKSFDRDYKEKSVETTNTCDPVLTQIALNANNTLVETQSKVLHINQVSSNAYMMNKRNLFNQNNNDDTFLPSINVSNLNAQSNSESQSHQTLNFSSQSLNFLNQPCDINNESTNKNQSFNLQSGLAINIIKPNNNNNNNLQETFGQYSMSLPTNYSNFMDFANGPFTNSHISTKPSQQLLPNSMNCNTDTNFSEDIENACRIDDPSMNNDINSSPQTSSHMIGSNDNYLMQSSNYGCLSMSLPAYTADNCFMKYKQQQQQTNQSHISSFQTNTVQNSQNLKSNNRSDNMSSPHLNKLLLSNNKVLSSFNSDSNLSCNNTAVSSLASMTSPLSSVHDDYENPSSLSSSNNINLSNILQDDEYDDELDSDDESINNDAFFDLMNKNRDTYFWQYNIQSKGPKTKKVLTLRNKDPHLHRDFFDPVYQLQTINSRGTSLNKLRKGDGNDVTPNSDKLFNLGLQIHDFIQKSYQMNNSANSTVDTNNHEKVNLKREKNKIASRACRLKKKAQHEANKLKLYGLNQEHKQLVETIHIAKDLIKKRLKNELAHDTSLVETMEEVCKQHLTTKVAGNTDSYVYSLMQTIENDRMNNLPSVKALYGNSKKQFNESNSNDTIINGMMMIDTNTSDNEKSNLDMKSININ